MQVHTLPDNTFVSLNEDGSAKIFQTATGKHTDPRHTLEINLGLEQVQDLVFFLLVEAVPHQDEPAPKPKLKVVKKPSKAGK